MLPDFKHRHCKSRWFRHLKQIDKVKKTQKWVHKMISSLPSSTLAKCDSSFQMNPFLDCVLTLDEK